MEVFRIVREKFANDISGDGAKLYGGRWNSIGIPCIYTSTNISLCLCEYLVNLPIFLLPKDLRLVSYKIPNETIKHVENSVLPKGWNTIPVSTASQFFGDELLKNNQMLAFSLPSVIIPQERNIVINPLALEFHYKFEIVSVEEFKLDQRFEK